LNAAEGQLLSLPSSDLDVALTIPSGYSFATEFVDYLKGEGVSTGSVGKVAVNPEQSKHLETGTTRILGLECDFVGLRSETYADSRIPDQVVSLTRSNAQAKS
jgi:tRNA nucleotidyltransferase (CCA-adding enzyme)